jgi:chromosome segregation ATPase
MQILEIKRPMEIYNYNNINDQEHEYLQLQNIIESKRNMLLKKQKKLQKISKQNVFLENIKNDYLKYNNYIVKQKEDQITALNLLNNYIEDLNRSGQLSKHNIQDAKAEQNKIVKELNSVKHGLDKIMNESKNINKSLLNKRTT